MYVEEFDQDLVSDCAMVVQTMLANAVEDEKDQAKIPIFLHAESMGGNIALRMIQKHPNRCKLSAFFLFLSFKFEFLM